MLGKVLYFLSLTLAAAVASPGARGIHNHTPSKPKPVVRESVIIDTDPGIDDMLALFLAIKSPELEIVGITTSFGNQRTPQTTRNTLRLLELANRTDIPVAQGSSECLFREHHRSPPVFVHGNDGMGDCGINDVVPTIKPIEKNAAQFIIDTVMARPGEITLIPIGSLTNIALAYRMEPRIAQAVKAIVMMGGNMAVAGNVSPVSEANVYDDPEAADVVFRAPWKNITMVGLDVTTKTIMDEEYLNRLAQVDKAMPKLITRIIPHYVNFHLQKLGKKLLYAHDPSAVAYVLDPTMFKTIHHAVRVATGGLTDGQTLVDRPNRFYPNQTKVDVCVEVDTRRVLKMFFNRVTRN